MQHWIADLCGKSFHVCLRRRGFKGPLSSQNEEEFLAGVLMEALEKSGSPGRITSADPDAIITIETVDCQAGLSLWTREELQRYPFLRLD
jgi:hypothetical protein